MQSRASESRGRVRSSSGNMPPYIDSPPVPLRLVKSVGWSDMPIFDEGILHASSLDHEILDAPVQNAVFVVERHARRRDAFFSST